MNYYISDASFLDKSIGEKLLGTCATNLDETSHAGNVEYLNLWWGGKRNRILSVKLDNGVICNLQLFKYNRNKTNVLFLTTL